MPALSAFGDIGGTAGIGSAIAGGLTTAAASQAALRQKSAVLKALEDSYRTAGTDSAKSAEASAKAAGTWADTQEFRKGLEDEAGLQAGGTKAALLARINALRSAEGFDAFNEADASAEGPPENILDLINGPKSTLAESNVRAQLLKEFEKAYGGLGTDVAGNFRSQAQSGGMDLNNPDNVRLLQSNVQSGLTGARGSLQARINALRTSLGKENFVDPMSSGQKFNQARLATQESVLGSAPTAAAAKEGETDESGEATPTAGSEDTASTQNAVTAAKKKTAPRVL